MKTIIFACVHSAGRSQMAAAFFRKHAKSTAITAISAGTNPASQIHPEVLEVMREVGIDLSMSTPTRLTDELAKTSELLVTMGCGENCPFIPGLKIEDWSIQDPKGQDLKQIRIIRDEIEQLVLKLIKKLFFNSNST